MWRRFHQVSCLSLLLFTSSQCVSACARRLCSSDLQTSFQASGDSSAAQQVDLADRENIRTGACRDPAEPGRSPACVSSRRRGCFSAVWTDGSRDYNEENQEAPEEDEQVSRNWRGECRLKEKHKLEPTNTLLRIWKWIDFTVQKLSWRIFKCYLPKQEVRMLTSTKVCSSNFLKFNVLLLHKTSLFTQTCK